MNSSTRLLFLLTAFSMVPSASGIVAQPLGTWKLLNPIQSFTVRTNPLDGKKILVGNSANRLYRSDDGGTTWYVVETGSTSATNFLTSVHIPSRDTSIALVGGFAFTGIKRGISNGEFATVLSDPSFRRMIFVSEAITEDADGNLFAARGSTYNSIWKSTDNGATWDSIAVIPTNETSKLLTIRAHPTIPGLLFVGAANARIYRSSDGGLTWASVPVLNGKHTMFPGTEVSQIAFSTINPEVGYAAVTIIDRGTTNDAGILKTSNAGLNWDRVAFPDTSFWAVSVRTLPGGKEEVVAGGFRQRTIPSKECVGDSLVFRSVDGGQTWERYQNIHWVISDPDSPIKNVWSLHVAPADNKLYMATEQGVYVMDDVPLSVSCSATAKGGLSISQHSGALFVSDMFPSQEPQAWSIYTTDGTRIAGGKVHCSQHQQISLGHCATGTYILVWGSGRSYRTVPFMFTR
ncbi:MAG: hypothetical protein IAE64_02330 [Flavobacteriales bacterium]|nr:MAG: hypothetical protein F9K28_06650 [Bacteroidota bacterium]KXK33923.1 MAG: glycosyl hydrolase [Chlorobi bacterium OLB6]MBE2265071.1 hypothetical protein [Flavobacteriales bacterium]MBV6464660.1 hypothetical protein [Chlorobiota bacterium]MBW7854062.1 hypothetical protein [Candidatus Kapabacteria bacterium]MCC6330555.1 hypothetical protein [Ignavibacteria bacterium]